MTESAADDEGPKWSQKPSVEPQQAKEEDKTIRHHPPTAWTPRRSPNLKEANSTKRKHIERNTEAHNQERPTPDGTQLQKETPGKNKEN